MEPLEWAKLKNIILIILLAANAFLLVLALDRENASRRYEDQAREEIVSILARGGISIEKETMPQEMAFSVCAVPRSEEAEAARAAQVLGEGTGPDGDGVYVSDVGRLRFYPDGAFSFSASERALPLAGESPASAAADFLSRLGLVVGPLEVSTPQREAWEPEETVVTAMLRYEDAPVFTPRALTVTFRADFLVSAEGYHLSGEPVPEESETPLSVVGILLRFSGYIKENIVVCREISGMTAGYTLVTSQGGIPRLIPTWHITADSGEYSLNAITGELL